MSKHLRRRSVALSAILSASLVPALGLAAPSAHAVNAGPADSTLTISDGTSTVVIGGKAVTFPTTVTDATWAPNGSRLAFVDGDGDLVSSLPNGSGIRLLARHGRPEVVFSHPTWTSDGGRVVFAESVNGTFGNLKAAKADGYGTSTTGGFDGTVVYDARGWTGAPYSSPDAVYIPSGSPLLGSQASQDDVVVQKGVGSAAELWGTIGAGYDIQSYKIADGSQPTISSDGKTVAFVNAEGQIAVADLTKLPTPPIKVLTKDPVHKQHPTFSPDGSKIAYAAFTPGTGGAADVAKDVESIPSTGGTPAVESAKPGVPAYRPTAVTHVTRLAGADRIGTAIAVSRAEFPDSAIGVQHPTSVVLARSDQYADALAGSVLAQGAPLLLTPSDALDPAVKNEIIRVLGPAQALYGSPTVTLLGGTQALSPAVENAITSLGYRVQRIAGPDRYATSVAIAEAANPYGHITRLAVATGDNFADALSASTIGMPVVLTDDKKMPAATADFLKHAFYSPVGAPTLYAVGGQAAAAAATLFPTGSTSPKVVPLAGSDRFETSFLVAREFFGVGQYARLGAVYVGVSTAYNWPDSLAGGTAMGNLQGPILLVDPKTGLTPEEHGWVSANSGTIDSALVFGGPVALSTAVDAQLGSTLSGPAGYVTATNPPSIPK